MIRTVALGVICLAGLGAITAAAKKPAPSPLPTEVVFPVVASNKADRLPVISNQETLIEADKVNAVYVPPTEEQQVVSSQPPPPPAKEAVSPSAPDFVPRHWHDPHEVKARPTKPTASVTTRSKKRSADRPNDQVRDIKDCRSDGLQPLLRKLNLTPPCDS